MSPVCAKGVVESTEILQNFLLTLVRLCEQTKCRATAEAGGSLVHEEARQRVHKMLKLPGWIGQWLGVMEDLPSEMEEVGLGWMVEGFPGHTGGLSSRRKQGSWRRMQRTGRK